MLPWISNGELSSIFLCIYYCICHPLMSFIFYFCLFFIYCYCSLLFTFIFIHISYLRGDLSPLPYDLLSSGKFPTDYFSVKWEGFMTSPQSGVYTFTVTSDYGVNIKVNNVTKINQIPMQTSSISFSMRLTAGQLNSVLIYYYHNRNNAYFSLRWSGPGVLDNSVVAPEYLSFARQIVDSPVRVEVYPGGIILYYFYIICVLMIEDVVRMFFFLFPPFFLLSYILLFSSLSLPLYFLSTLFSHLFLLSLLYRYCRVSDLHRHRHPSIRLHCSTDLSVHYTGQRWQWK